ncbi:hypothetical protein C7T35_21355 [Variovorax sp. WS11]|uniref:class I adenylate-forming enzyme family protein n=1 Tax=Variovorax sp. WS11 TaxID=1105204 RepID=UPI000D0D93FE|nr:AMP-binding protein [Variovorax sp. WS11]NDZ18779.1 AMP-binding protein [Variovorax sp. WS11]PSL82555.1 hypothetical protein C7T35_21355 [Variovorax sp. WS11]
MAAEVIECDLLGDLPSLAVHRWGDRSALVFKDRTWSYRQFNQEVEILARALSCAGVQQGDKVAVWLPNSPELQFLLFAIVRIGAVAVPLNTRYKSSELAFALRHSGSVFLVSCTRAGPVDFEALLADALGLVPEEQNGNATFPAAPQLKTVVLIGDANLPGSISWEQFREPGTRPSAQVTLPTVCASDTAMMMFTSGTTGRPKGVLLNHAGLRLCRDRSRIMGLVESDVQLTYLPLFHIYAIGYSVIMSFLCGAKQVLMEMFNGEHALRLIHQHRVTVVHGFEAHFADLLAAKARLDLDIGSLRTASFATGAESVRTLAQSVQRELCETAASYGLTEMWGGISITSPGTTLSQRCEASGLPQPGIDVRIVDIDTGEVLPSGAVGEIQVRSYARLIAYHQDPEATRDALDGEGWFRTGDAGLLREDGHLRYLARYKDMLKVGGENVAPAEIEELLCKMPGIRSAAVVGRKSERLQEVPVAFVVPEVGAQPSEEEVIELFRGKIASFKIPVRVIFVDELPMTSTGKVQKEALRQRLNLNSTE